MPIVLIIIYVNTAYWNLLVSTNGVSITFLLFPMSRKCLIYVENEKWVSEPQSPYCIFKAEKWNFSKISFC